MSEPIKMTYDITRDAYVVHLRDGATKSYSANHIQPEHIKGIHGWEAQARYLLANCEPLDNGK